MKNVSSPNVIQTKDVAITHFIIFNGMNHLQIIINIYNKYKANSKKMSVFLIILAAGDSKRLKSNTPKPFHIVNNKTLLEHSFNAFKDFNEIKKTIIVYNKKHKKYLDKLNLKRALKVIGGKTRQESTFKALKRDKKNEL